MTGLSTRTAAALMAVAAVVLVAGCGSSDGSASSADYSMEESMPMDGGIAAEASRVDIAPQVIRTASAYLEVESVDTAAGEIVEATAAAQGTVDSQNISRGDDWTSASFTLRIPEAGLDSFLDNLASVGDVTSLDVSAQDVTLEVVDIEARIQTLEDSIERLRELQAQTTSVADLVAVESELANRQSELESLSARRDYLANQVALSTVYVSLAERAVGPSLTPDFLGGLQSGWDTLLTLGAGLITALGFMLPTAILVGLTVIVVVWLVRRRRRSNERTSR